MSSPSSELDPKKTHIVRAGAGAGKTRALTMQVMAAAKSFHAEHGRWPRVVVTTFTRKATQELRERLMLQALEIEPNLIEFVNSRSHLTVSTIHGVLDLYLKRYGGHLRIDPNYRVIEKFEASHLARKALRSVLFDNADLQTLLEIFDFKQLVAMARQYHELLLKNPHATPHTLLTLGDAYHASAEALAQALKEAAVSIHAEAQGPQQEAWLEVAEELSRAARVFSKPESRAFVKEIFDGLAIPRFNPKNPSITEETKDFVRETVEEASSFIDAQDPALWPLFVENFSRFAVLAKKFSEVFIKLKVEIGAVEMSDLELLTMESLRKAPHTAEAFADEWDFWLIDEYQDTSPFQVELLRGLMGEKPAFIVGDPQQSIYLFRGARSEVFAKKENDVLAAGGQQSFLITNYRSRPELLLFFNDLFGRMEPPFSAMRAKPDGGLTGKDVATIFIAPKPDRQAAPVADPELEAITAHVVKLLGDGAKAESISILGRTHQTLSQVSARLAAAHVPVHVHAAAGFYERREIQDALALLRFLLNPHDNVNLVQLLRSPWFRVADEVLAKAAKPDRTLWSGLSAESGEAVARLQGLLELRTKLGLSSVFRSALIESGLLDSAHQLDPSGRREANLWKLLSLLQSEESRPGFNPLEFVNTGLSEMAGSESEESDAVAAVEPNRVNLMTVHASKGLAFDHVIVPKLHQAPRVKTFDHFLFDEDRKLWSMRLPLGVERKSTPSIAERIWLKTFQEHERREHARVLYVALTRARESVFLSFTGSPQRHSWGDLLKIDLGEGEHKTPEYAYRVITQVDALTSSARLAPKAVPPRKPWTAKATRPVMNSISVSRLLEKIMLAKSSAPSDSGAPVVKRSTPLLMRVQVSSQGTAVHKLMEMLKYRTREQVERLVQQWFPKRTEKVTRAIDWMGEQQSPPIMQAIEQGHVEWGFAFVQNQTVIEGQIDLWARLTEANGTATVWILDYKTGNPDYKEQAFNQLGLYSLALHRADEIKASDRVRLAIIYPFAEKIELRDAPSEAASVAALSTL